MKLKGNLMPDKPVNHEAVDQSPSGVLRAVKDPISKHEPPAPPSSLPEMLDPGATTSKMRIVTEGQDRSAERDHDAAQGS